MKKSSEVFVCCFVLRENWQLATLLSYCKEPREKAEIVPVPVFLLCCFFFFLFKCWAKLILSNLCIVYKNMLELWRLS